MKWIQETSGRFLPFERIDEITWTIDLIDFESCQITLPLFELMEANKAKAIRAEPTRVIKYQHHQQQQQQQFVCNRACVGKHTLIDLRIKRRRHLEQQISGN